MDFALIGAAGFVAPRHMRAIAANGHRLVAALDPNDSVGILDQHFPDASFFLEFEQFEGHLDQLRRSGNGISYLSVCSPNYLHDAHVRLGLRNGAHVICEKPLVLDPSQVDRLLEIEGEGSSRVFTVMQLRLHPAIRALRERVQAAPRSKAEVVLTYVTGRGSWYHASWKGDVTKSGGLTTNIGIHFFDMLIWTFGAVQESHLHCMDERTAAGHLELERASVRWLLSLDVGFVPQQLAARGQRTFRSITVDGQELEFSEGFTDLHTETYRDILSGGGFKIGDIRPSIELAHQLRNAPPRLRDELAHPLLLATRG